MTGAFRIPRARPVRHRRAGRASIATLCLVACAAVAPALAAQEGSPPVAGHVGAQAIGLLTHAAPALGGRDYTEGYLTQPNVMGELSLLGLLRFTGTLNLEGLTLERGELNAGIFGEGYVDRRHPHTLVHEAMASAVARIGPLALSLAGGKGFVPFGTDDPMMRPFAKYPVNHHYAQLLERVQVVGAVRWRGVTIEGATFNGDEPLGPYEAPAWSRVGDSRAVRLTVAPARGLELQGSMAAVTSPEQFVGGGLDHAKASASARFARHDRYLLVEWARTQEHQGGRDGFAWETALAEGAATLGRLDVALRVERTERPEEERLADLFRAQRPHHDENILGATRWHVVTAAVSAPGLPWGVRRDDRRWSLAPFVEAGWQHVASLYERAVFQPAPFYGATSLWSLSLGVRARVGHAHARMGRYGAADDRLDARRDERHAEH